MKQFWRIIERYYPWLLLLLGVDCFYSIILWISDIQAFQAIEGKMLDSVELSQKIDRLGVSGTSHIAFVIGGSLGLAPAVMKRANYALSFSRMTFPHQLMRVVLLEQLYRSYRILKNEPYHK